MPFRKGGVFVGMAILWSVVLNTLIWSYTTWGSDLMWTWAPILVFIGVLLVLFSWQDHMLATIFAGAAAVLWWWFIQGGL